MTEENKSYKWAKFKNGIGYFAIVDLCVSKSNSDQNEIIESYTGMGFSSQENIESVPFTGYDDWKIAAVQGLLYALSLTNEKWKTQINKIEGRAFTDTNPTIVGYTVFRAFCDQIHLELDDNIIDKLETFVFKSWSTPNETLIPDFTTQSYIQKK